MSGLAAGELSTLVRLERPVVDDAFDGAGSGSWTVVENGVWASIVDMLPSRGERLADGLNVATRPSRVRMRFRTDVDASMRLVDVTDGVDGRVMQIITPPATIMNRTGVEFMVEDYSTAGNAA